MNVEERANKFSRDAAYQSCYIGYIQGVKDEREKICNWLRKKLVTDHIDTDHGIGCIMPDIILCHEYFTVDDLIENMIKDLDKDEI